MSENLLEKRQKRRETGRGRDDFEDDTSDELKTNEEADEMRQRITEKLEYSTTVFGIRPVTRKQVEDMVMNLDRLKVTNAGEPYSDKINKASKTILKNFCRDNLKMNPK